MESRINKKLTVLTFFPLDTAVQDLLKRKHVGTICLTNQDELFYHFSELIQFHKTQGGKAT